VQQVRKIPGRGRAVDLWVLAMLVADNTQDPTGLSSPSLTIHPQGLDLHATIIESLNNA